jgi:hypothetical protein
MIRGDAMRAAEAAAGEVVLRVHPTQEAERRRQDVIGYLKRLVGSSVGCEVRVPPSPTEPHARALASRGACSSLSPCPAAAPRGSRGRVAVQLWEKGGLVSRSVSCGSAASSSIPGSHACRCLPGFAIAAYCTGALALRRSLSPGTCGGLGGGR